MLSLLNLILVSANITVDYIPPYPVSGISLIRLKSTSDILIFSGRQSKDTYYNGFQILSQSDKNLTQNLSLTTFPSPRSNYATYFNRYTYEVYIYGGIGEDGILGDFWIFNLFKGYWYQYFSEVSLKPAYDSVVCSMLASKIILKIYIYGGTSKLKTIDNMILIKFNIETNDFQLSQFIIGSDFSYSGSQIQYHNRFFYIFSGYSISGPFYEKKYLRDIVKCELLFTNCSLIVLENKGVRVLGC